MTFEQALKTMPSIIAGGYDSFQHKTVDDLAFMAQFELDLYDEGDDGATIKIHKQYIRVKRWKDSLER